MTDRTEDIGDTRRSSWKLAHALEGDVAKDERVKSVAAMLEGEESFLELCERFGISRKQGYKWKERYELGGVEALADRSRAPHSSARSKR